MRLYIHTHWHAHTSRTTWHVTRTFTSRRHTTYRRASSQVRCPMLTHAYSCTRTHTHAHSRTLMHTHAHSCTLMHNHAHSCTLMHTHAHLCTLVHTHAHSRTLMHTHAHSHSMAHDDEAGQENTLCTYTHIHTLTYMYMTMSQSFRKLPCTSTALFRYAHDDACKRICVHKIFAFFGPYRVRMHMFEFKCLCAFTSLSYELQIHIQACVHLSA